MKDNIIHIKSKDLCDRCANNRTNLCNPRILQGKHCSDCPMYGRELCKCVEVMFYTPCPYFDEAEQN